MSKINKSTGHLVKHDLNALTGWEELEAAEQSTVKQETAALDKALLVAGNAKLSIGEHLFRIREILEPKRMFTQYLQSMNFSRASAYRYIDVFTAAKTILPAPVLRVAMLRGGDKLNIKLMTATPPPKTTNVVKINEYLTEMERSGPRLVESSSTPDSLKKECYNYVHLRFQRLPNNHKTRSAWLHSLTGMLLAELGVSGTQSIEPVAIPDGYKAVRGRPKKKVA